MSFGSTVRERALLSCGRRCCICHKFCGLKIELHHIDQASEGGQDTFENCIPLCFDCHADMRSYDHHHPKGSKYTPSELKRHRDSWYEKVSRSPGPGAKGEALAVDVRVFKWLLNRLPWEGPICFLRDQSFGGSLRRDHFDPFEKFLGEADNPAREFFDADLESLRSKLVSSLGKLISMVRRNIVDVGVPGIVRLAGEWRHDDPDRFDALCKKFDTAQDAVVADYRALVQEGRLRLGDQWPEPD